MMVKAFQEQQILEKQIILFFTFSFSFNKPITINDIKKICIPEPINAARTFLRRGGRKTSPCTLKQKFVY
jgi:hypothetical protein